MIFQDAQRSLEAVRRTTATLCTWWRAGPGERLEYCRGCLAINRIKRTRPLEASELRKLTAVADHALTLASRERLHLLHERHASLDYPSWAVARTLVQSGQA
jgi:hypothetical protein